MRGGPWVESGCDCTVQSVNTRCEVCENIYGYRDVRTLARKSNEVPTAGLLEVFNDVGDESDDGRDSSVCVFWVCATDTQKGGNGREDQLVREGPL